MEYKALSSNLKHLAPNGVTLNMDEKMQVGLALTQLQTEMQFEELYFWGKVEGRCMREGGEGGEEGIPFKTITSQFFETGGITDFSPKFHHSVFPKSLSKISITKN